MLERAIQPSVPAAVARLQALAPLDAVGLAALLAATGRPRTVRARRDLLVEGREITERLLILSGWAARVRLLQDGRRQILSVILPGELIGDCDHERPVSTSTVLALTEVDVCAAPPASASPAIGRAYALSRAFEEACLIAQITRLGRLDAHERIVDLLLEFNDRLTLSGLAQRGRYVLPLTQETMADVLGLTAVHVNRTLQGLRRSGALAWSGRELTLSDPAALARSFGHSPLRPNLV